MISWAKAEQKKPRKAGFKSLLIKVPAGTPIGCDTCHNLELSFQ